jgi:hypothetical protein
MRADLDKVNIETLISSAVFAQTVASKVFEIYPPTPLMRRVGCKIILSAGWTPADRSDVLPDFHGQAVYVMGIPWIILMHGAALGNCRYFTADQEAKSQRQGTDCHSTLLLYRGTQARDETKFALASRWF